MSQELLRNLDSMKPSLMHVFKSRGIVPANFVESAVQAIQAFRDYGMDSLNDHIELPDGYLWRERNYAPVRHILDTYELWDWVEYEG